MKSASTGSPSAYIVAIALAVGVCLGLAPALRLRTDEPQPRAPRGKPRRHGEPAREPHSARRWPIAQVAIALALLVGAGLLLASFRAVLRLDLGFDPENVMTAAVVAARLAAIPTLRRCVTFEQRALAAIRALPGVEAAGTTSAVPFSGAINNNVIMAEGYAMKPGEIAPRAPSSVTSTLATSRPCTSQLVRGRFVRRARHAGRSAAVIIDDRLAAQVLARSGPRRPPAVSSGRSERHHEDHGADEFLTIVGVIREIRMIDPRPDVTPVGTVYFPWEQQAGRGPTLVVKTRRDVPAIYERIRREIASINPQLPVFRERTMQEWIDRQLIGRRLPMFVALALALSRCSRGHRDVRRARLQRQRAPARAGCAHGARRIVRQRLQPRAPRRRSRDRRRVGARTDWVLLGRSRCAEPARGRRTDEPVVFLSVAACSRPWV